MPCGDTRILNLSAHHLFLLLPLLSSFPSSCIIIINFIIIPFVSGPDRPALYCTAGVHPTRAGEVAGREREVMERLATLIQATNAPASSSSSSSSSLSSTDGHHHPHQHGPTIVAIGECGLDWDRLHFSTKEEQLSVFPMHIELARRLDLPLFLHMRNCCNDFVRCIVQASSTGAVPLRGVIHSFTGSEDEMMRMIDLGFYIGINGCSMKTEEGCRVSCDVA